MTPSIYLDTDIFVTAFETTDAQSDYAWTLLDAVTQGRVQANTSELTLAELLPKPLRLGSDLLVELYTGLIKPGNTLSVWGVTRAVLVEAAQIRAARRAVKLPDAIHIATALEAGCTALVSDDDRLQQSPSLALIQLGPDCLKRIEDFRS